MKNQDTQAQGLTESGSIDELGKASDVTKGDFMPDASESLVLKDRIYEP